MKSALPMNETTFITFLHRINVKTKEAGTTPNTTSRNILNQFKKIHMIKESMLAMHYIASLEKQVAWSLHNSSIPNKHVTM